jgi:hypothetical protein
MLQRFPLLIALYYYSNRHSFFYLLSTVAQRIINS